MPRDSNTFLTPTVCINRPMVKGEWFCSTNSMASIFLWMLLGILLHVSVLSDPLVGQISESKTSLMDIAADLMIPPLSDQAKPQAGLRVRVTTDGWSDTEVYHVCYLPTNWKPDAKFPVLVEFPGNGGYTNALGDRSTGRVEDVKLGYGLSQGRDFIWIAMPYIELIDGRKQNALKWWGDPDETKRYCLATLRQLEESYGANCNQVVLCGFSRGAIGCNVVGLFDDEIAKIWTGFFCHSHYDGVREKQWYPLGDRESVNARLARLGNRPTWISHEGSIENTRAYLQTKVPRGNFTYEALPFPNHTDAWVLRDLPIRRHARQWLHDVIRIQDTIAAGTK